MSLAGGGYCGGVLAAEHYDYKAEVQALHSLDQRGIALTLIASCASQEGLYLGADTQLQDGHLTTHGHKLQWRHAAPHLGWGTSGDVGIGLEWSSWLSAHSADWPSWREFRDDASRQLATLNGRKRENMRLAGVAEAPGLLTRVLVAGYIAEKPEILEIDHDGTDAFYFADAAGAIGTGRMAFIMAAQLYAVFYKSRFPFSEQTFTNLMGAASLYSAQCARPIDVVRIGPDGVDKLVWSDIGA